MSFRKGFDTGYNLAVRHVIERVEEMLGDRGDHSGRFTDELREFYKNELREEGMQVTASSDKTPENAQT